MSDVIVIMNKGKIHQIGTPFDIYYRPKTRFVADFIGATNFLEGHVSAISANRLQVAYGNHSVQVETDAHVAVGERALLSIRPESLRIQSVPDDQAGLCLPVVIKHSMFLGEKVRYFVTDPQEKEWLVDAFDSGRNIFKGSAFLVAEASNPCLIVEE